MSDRDLPTIEQIIRKADSLGGVPMDSEEAEEWFKETVEENRDRRIREAKP